MSTASMVTTFPNNDRLQSFKEWLKTEFGDKAGKHTGFLNAPNAQLGGQTPIAAVAGSDSGMQTVKHMLRPIRGC